MPDAISDTPDAAPLTRSLAVSMVLPTILPAVSTVVVTTFPAVPTVLVIVFPAASTVFSNTSPVSFNPVAAAPAHVPGEELIEPAALYKSDGVYFLPLQSTISPFELMDKLQPEDAGHAGHAGHTGGTTSVFNI